MPTRPPPDAALFDWDGVVIDSSAQHEESWERLAAEEMLTLPEDHFKAGFGRKNQWIIPNLLNWTDDPPAIERLSQRKEMLYREIVAERGLEALPGVRELFHALRAEGVPLAIGSSTPRANLDMALEILGLHGLFDAIVSAEDVSHGKPDPEVFLSGAARLGAAPNRTVVFEDALVGIEAAQRGGMKVVAVATTNPIGLLAHADLAVESLGDVTIERLRQLWLP